MIRKSVVAGQFYPGSPGPLKHKIDSLVDTAQKKESALGVLSPHAGYMYSGAVAGAVLSAVTPKSKYIILGPNHTGMGEPFGLSACESWETPLGEARLDKKLASAIKDNSKYVVWDELSNAAEHSIEVQLPFLQVLNKKFDFVPIVVSYGDPKIYKEIGRSIAKSLRDSRAEKDTVIIASSDMTHYEPQESARKKDYIAIDAMLNLDEDKLLESIDRFGITMCGFAPAVIMMTAVKELGAHRAKLIKYQTSGDVSGDFSSVVGYAGIAIS